MRYRTKSTVFDSHFYILLMKNIHTSAFRVWRGMQSLSPTVFGSATGLLPLDLLVIKFADSIDSEKTGIRCVARKDCACLLSISAHFRSLPSITSSPTARSISLYSFSHIVSYAHQSVVLDPQLGIKAW